jgi:hypothetical protein
MDSIGTNVATINAKRRVFLAIGLIALAAFATIRLPLRTFGELARGGLREQTGDQFERLRELDRQLPSPRPDSGGPIASIWAVAAVLCPCWAAYAVICACSRELPPSRQIRALRVSLATGTGLGLSSLTYFLWLMVFGQPQTMFLFVDTLFWCLVVFVCKPDNQTKTTVSRVIAPPQDSTTLHASVSRQVACLFAIIAVIALAGLAGQALVSPSGGWDARAIWNLRAHYLFRAGDEWRGAFTAAFDHTDYPLLIPAALARYWTFLGNDPAWPGACLGIAFTVATIALVVTAIGTERRWSLGLLAGMVLLGTVRLLRWGALQYADVPLAFFFLATFWVLLQHDEQISARGGRYSAGLLSLAGLMIGLAAWTKNEGLVFALVVLVTRAALRALQTGWKQSLQECRSTLAGALPLLLILLLFKSQVSATNDLVASLGLAETMRRVLDPARHLAIGRAFLAGGLQVVHAFAVIVPLCFLLLGRRTPTTADRTISWFVLVVLGLMLAAYDLAYLTTPYELKWHLSTSVDRLLVQLWPIAVLAVFRQLRAPEEVWPTVDCGVGLLTCPVPNAPHFASVGDSFNRDSQDNLESQRKPILPKMAEEARVSES